MSRPHETCRRFGCFGGTAGVYVGDPQRGSAESSAAHAELQLLDIHRRLSRFEPDSELSLLNADPREEIPVSGLMLDLADATRWAGETSRGLVDATCLPDLLDAGYTRSLDRRGSSPAAAAVLSNGAQRRPAGADPRALWQEVRTDRDHGLVMRPPGLLLDSGGIGKGLAADRVAAGLGHHATFAVDCCGDIVIGGEAADPRAISVADPFGRGTAHTLTLRRGAIATSGVLRRSWNSRSGPAHHLIDPATGEPAFTGVVQATAVADSGVEAETLAKTALLSGPELGRQALRGGGVLVLEDGTVDVVQPMVTAVA